MDTEIILVTNNFHVKLETDLLVAGPLVKTMAKIHRAAQDN